MRMVCWQTIGMIFHENRLQADYWHDIPYFFQKLGKLWQNLSSAAVVIGALRDPDFVWFDFYVPVNNFFQLCWDGFSWVEP